MKQVRTNWRNLPPKKMIRSRGWVQTGERQYKIDLSHVDISDISIEFGDVARLIMRGFMGNLSHEVIERMPLHEHIFTTKQTDEPMLKMEFKDVPVSYALYNQLIVREPESSYVGVNVTV